MSDYGSCRISSANAGGERVSSLPIRQNQGDAKQAGQQLLARLAPGRRAKALARENEGSVLIFPLVRPEHWSGEARGLCRIAHRRNDRQWEARTATARPDPT